MCVCVFGERGLCLLTVVCARGLWPQLRLMSRGGSGVVLCAFQSHGWGVRLVSRPRPPPSPLLSCLSSWNRLLLVVWRPGRGASLESSLWAPALVHPPS